MAPDADAVAASRASAAVRRTRPARTGPVGARVLALLLVVAVVVLVRHAVAAPVRVDGASMAPTLQPGQVVLVQKVHTGGVSRGDLVLFDSPQDGTSTVKRVVAVAGQTVVTRDAVLEVDGRAVAEPYVDHESIDAYYSPTVRVPAGHVFVLGDNRARSIDSNTYGPVPTASITGTVLARLWPPALL